MKSDIGGRQIEFTVEACVPSLTRNENICELFAVYAAMSEKQKFIMTVSDNVDC